MRHKTLDTKSFKRRQAFAYPQSLHYPDHQNSLIGQTTLGQADRPAAMVGQILLSTLNVKNPLAAHLLTGERAPELVYFFPSKAIL